MPDSLGRRAFLQSAAATASAAAALTTGGGLFAADAPAPVAATANGAQRKLVVGIMGLNGRGASLAGAFARAPDCAVGYVCDVDRRTIDKAAQAVEAVQGTKPVGVGDFRRILEDKSVDALVVAAPDHWHAPATIIAAAHKKHVYVEKPCSHNPREGEWAIAAARKNNVVVTMGNQRRSWVGVQKGIAKLREGVIGDVRFARAWYNNRRQPVPVGKTAPVPEWLDFALWQGPAPSREFRDNLLHYHWHWYWHWGTGELGNNGIHALDLARWGLGVTYPRRVTAAGGRYNYQDAWETPDTHLVSYEFDRAAIAWEGLSCSPRGFEGTMFGASFHGLGGSLVLLDSGYKIYDGANKLVSEESGPSSDALHVVNFLDCIRSGGRPNSDIEGAHQSTLLCHLGNIALRTGRALSCDPANGRIQNDAAAMELWGRTYQPEWNPEKWLA